MQVIAVEFNVSAHEYMQVHMSAAECRRVHASEPSEHEYVSVR